MNSRQLGISSCALNRFRCIGVVALLFLVALSAKPATAQGFAAPAAYAVGASPQAIAVADLNGDGSPDMVVVGSNVSVLLGNGNGTFQPAVNYAVAGSSIAIADLNGDGKPDLVVGTSSGVAILLGNGNGTFQTAFTYAAAFGQVLIGDFNGDGKLDIVTSGGTTLLGNGNGTFQMGPSFSPTGTSAVSGDFNGDGKLDLAVTPQCTGTVQILTGNGNGTFSIGSTFGYVDNVICPTASLGVGDFNNDGRLDLVASGFGSGASEDPETAITVALGNGNGTFTVVGTDPVYNEFSSGFTSVSVGDFNGDGKQDIAVARQQTGALVYVGNGDGTFQMPTVWGPPSSAVAIGDFDKNGSQDLATISFSGNNAAILLGNGNATFQAPISYYTGFPSAVPISILTGDFNGDGKLDMEVLSEVFFEGITPLETLLGNGDGTFQSFTAQGFTTSWSLSGAAAGDLNGDGKEDLAIAANNDGVAVYLGNGDGTFHGGVDFGNPSDSVAVADFNGDGKQDLVSASGTLDVLLGNGDGTFQPPASYPCGPGCGFIRLGDFNGDGKADVAATEGSNSIAIFLGNGDGTFKTAVSYSVGNGPASITAGDFNGDGKQDIAVATNGGIYVLLGNGDGTFQSAELVGSPSPSVSITAVDFNGDGKLDLISANGYPSAGGVSVFSGNGDGTFQLFATYEQGTSITLVKSADFNGDGAPDFAVGTSLEAIATVFMNKGGTYIKTATSNSSLFFDQPVTFTATISASVSGSGAPSGNFSFFDSSTLLGTASVESGEASITVPSLSVGTHTIIAVYSGDSHFNPHTAAPLTQRVQQAGTQSSIVSSANPSIPGQAVTFTATVTSLTSGIPTGNVTFSNGGTITYGVATLNSSGQANLTLSNLKPGSDYIGAIYSGDSNYALSDSGLLLQLVTRQASTTALTSSANPITAGQSVTFTATVSSSVGPPKNGDVVTFKNGAAILGTVTISASVATFTTAALPPGSDMIRATFPGDATLLASTSNVLTETVNNFSSTTTLVSNLNPSTFGKSVTFTATVSVVSGGAPGGTVTFKNGAAMLGTQNLSGGVATLSTNVLTVGTHSITAVYSGDATHTGSASSALSQVVNKASTTASLTSSKNPSTFGQSVTFTVTITPSGSGTPTGSVSFKSGTKSLGGVQLASGVATLTTTTLAAGSDTITATYSGSASFLTSSATLTQVVN